MYALNPFIPSATIPFAQFRLHFALPTVLEPNICYIDNDSLFDSSKETMLCQVLTLYSTILILTGINSNDFYTQIDKGHQSDT